METLEFSQQLESARQLMQSRRHGHALRLYAQLSQDATDYRFWEEYGRAAGTAGDFELAERIWEKVRALQPNTAESLLRLAGEYGNIWLFSKARALSFQAANLE